MDFPALLFLDFGPRAQGRGKGIKAGREPLLSTTSSSGVRGAVSRAEREVTPEDAGTPTCCPGLFVPETCGMWGHLLRVKGMGVGKGT